MADVTVTSSPAHGRKAMRVPRRRLCAQPTAACGRETRKPPPEPVAWASTEESAEVPAERPVSAEDAAGRLPAAAADDDDRGDDVRGAPGNGGLGCGCSGHGSDFVQKFSKQHATTP
ncbi:hypothetical protein HPB52_000870 [Rhipicephalus sanguineus]|uniref:Uncharacterized protein n=1 Tax=Rhipicephalus sanguineus TaxID=34632 RepID=A0A9D4PTI9_RHISA|nr:hypothetical protein HPB52_000870 [Rhipicephalus sanguineus]